MCEKLEQNIEKFINDLKKSISDEIKQEIGGAKKSQDTMAIKFTINLSREYDMNDYPFLK